MTALAVAVPDSESAATTGTDTTLSESETPSLALKLELAVAARHCAGAARRLGPRPGRDTMQCVRQRTVPDLYVHLQLTSP